MIDDLINYAFINNNIRRDNIMNNQSSIVIMITNLTFMVGYHYGQLRNHVCDILDAWL